MNSLWLIAMLSVSAAPDDANDLPGWMAGHWCSAGSEELWLAPRDGHMLGMNRQFGRAAGFEFMRIVLVEGELVLQAQPGGAAPTVFRAVDNPEAGAKQRISFADPGHDFPRRIHYWRSSEGLHAAIDDGSDARRMEFAWQPCAE